MAAVYYEICARITKNQQTKKNPPVTAGEKEKSPDPCGGAGVAV